MCWEHVLEDATAYQVPFLSPRRRNRSAQDTNFTQRPTNPNQRLSVLACFSSPAGRPILNVVRSPEIRRHLLQISAKSSLTSANSGMDGRPSESKNEPNSLSSSQNQTGENEIKSRVDVVWQQMNKGVSSKTLYSIVNNHNSSRDKPVVKEVSNNWMTVLGLGPKKTEANGSCAEKSKTSTTQNGTSEEAKKLAAAALAAAKKDAAAAASAALSRGKIEVTEVRDFAGEEVEVKKLIDPSSKEAVSGGPSSAVDAVLEQIKKKPKLSVLDKTKKDWGEFKEENKGLEVELESYKKSSNQYLDRVSFLQRADYREFERERDARLAMQAKRGRPDMRED